MSCRLSYTFHRRFTGRNTSIPTSVRTLTVLHLVSDVIENYLKLRIFQIQLQSYKDLFRLPKKTNRIQKKCSRPGSKKNFSYVIIWNSSILRYRGVSPILSRRAVSVLLPWVWLSTFMIWFRSTLELELNFANIDYQYVTSGFLMLWYQNVPNL